jgi:hypothetical protein
MSLLCSLAIATIAHHSVSKVPLARAQSYRDLVAGSPLAYRYIFGAIATLRQYQPCPTKTPHPEGRVAAGPTQCLLQHVLSHFTMTSRRRSGLAFVAW